MLKFFNYSYKYIILGTISMVLFSNINAAEPPAVNVGHGHGTTVSTNTVQKGGGYNLGNKIIFSVNSGNLYCPTSQLLIDSQKNKGHGRYGTLECMKKDYHSPTISVNFNGYLTEKWTNKDVKMDVSVSDVLGPGDTVSTGVKKTWYKINGETINSSAGSNFSLNFTDDGIYEVTIGAEDNSTHIAENGSSTSEGNIGRFTYIIKIDKFGPIITGIPSTDYNWKNIKPTLTFAIDDKYKGQKIEIKTFTCIGKPENSTRKTPSSPEGIISGNCDPNIKNCTLDSNFTPNKTSCLWDCNSGYTEGSDNKCYADTKILSCSVNPLPKGGYEYNTGNILVSLPDISPAYRSSPKDNKGESIVGNIDGNYLAIFNSINNNYLPEISSCSFSCNDGFHNEDGKCINDTASLCCEKNYPLTKSVTIGVAVDCTLPENAANVACTYNTLCNGYVKDVLKSWVNNTRKYTTEGVDNIGTLPEACGMQNIPNSNGITCNPKYELIGGGTATQVCQLVPIGMRSGQENGKHDCTNKPSNSYYTSNGDDNNCNWSCNENFDKDGQRCLGKTKNTNCTNKPANTLWNLTDKIRQVWDGNSRTPTNTTIYNTNPSLTECRYKCDDGYHYEGTRCVQDIRSCTIINGEGSQSWDGDSRSTCIPISCDNGFIINNNECVASH